MRPSFLNGRANSEGCTTNRMSRDGKISPARRTSLREKIIVKNLINDYTKEYKVLP